MTEQYLSKNKHAELVEELNMLKTVKRKEIADKLAYAKSLGDLSENAEYHDAKEAHRGLEERIQKIENILKFVVITEDHHSSVVEIGSTIVIQKDGADESERLTLVGSEEADFSQNKISNESPLGAAMVGLTRADKFKIESPRGTASYKILDIE
ncbi:MAG: transcription elongation factor GreA [bacterium]|nr:transcription elongation factor GreA [bacterium]